MPQPFFLPSSCVFQMEISSAKRDTLWQSAGRVLWATQAAHCLWGVETTASSRAKPRKYNSEHLQMEGKQNCG